jgi:hypothetical protein
MGHFWELQGASEVASELILEDLDEFSSSFDVGHVVSGWVQKSGAFHFLG